MKRKRRRQARNSKRRDGHRSGNAVCHLLAVVASAVIGSLVVLLGGGAAAIAAYTEENITIVLGGTSALYIGLFYVSARFVIAVESPDLDRRVSQRIVDLLEHLVRRPQRDPSETGKPPYVLITMLVAVIVLAMLVGGM